MPLSLQNVIYRHIHYMYIYTTYLVIWFIYSSSYHNLIIQHYGNVYTEPFTKRP